MTRRPPTPLARALTLFLPGVLAAWLSCLPLTWDGSYFLIDLLGHGRPVLVHGRPSMLLFQVPASIAGHLTSSTTLIGLAFSLPYVVVPVAALAMSWWAVRDTRPELVVWAAVGIGFVTLPGQAFFVSESLMVGQFLWPLALGVVAGHRWNRPLLLALLAFLVLLHPMAAPTLGLVAGVAVLVAWLRPGDRAASLQAVALFGGFAVLRQVLTWLGVDADVPSMLEVQAQWDGAVVGRPLTAMVLVAAGAASLTVATVLRPKAAPGVRAVLRTLLLLGFVLLGTGGAVMVSWGAGRTVWWQALDYRTFVLLFAIPPLLCATVDGLRPQEHLAREHAGPTRVAVVALCGLVFSATLVGQSVGWAGLVSDLHHRVEASRAPCVVQGRVEEPHTALRHWAVPSLSLVVQGRRPRTVVVGEESACDVFARTGSVPIPRTDHRRNPLGGWFDLSLVRLRVLAERPATGRPAG